MAAPSMYPAVEQVFIVKFRVPDFADALKERVHARSATAAISKVMSQHGCDVDIMDVARA